MKRLIGVPLIVAVLFIALLFSFGAAEAGGGPTTTFPPIQLHAGWNWIAYLPSVPQDLPGALASIEGKYDYVVGEYGTYSVSVPYLGANTLTKMEPGRGYLIRMKEAGTLVYADDAVPAPTSIPEGRGSFRIVLSNTKTDLVCNQGDLECRYSSAVTGYNRTNSTLYNTTLWTSSSPRDIMTYFDFDGARVSGVSKPLLRAVLPGESAFTTAVTVSVPTDKAQKYQAHFYADARTCNYNVNPPDCIYYGGSGFTVNITVVANSPQSSSTPSPTPIRTSAAPTKTPAIKK